MFDQYLNFIVGEPDLFSLGLRNQNTYWALNSARVNDQELDGIVDRIVSGLFSVVVTMGMMEFSRSTTMFADPCTRSDPGHTLPQG